MDAVLTPPNVRASRISIEKFFTLFDPFCRISKESIVDVYATVKKAPSKIESCTQHDVEMQVKKCFVMSPAVPQLPLQVCI